MDPLTTDRPAAGHLKLMGGLDMDTLEQARTILVVEDNVLMRKLFVRCLEEGGYTVVEAEDPRDVVDLMLDATPDLVVMDIVMPGMSGVELIKLIRGDSRLSRTPVLAVTNLATPADKRRLADAGFNGHVSKPIKPKDFITTVGSFFGIAAAEPA
ncbi:response regulator [Azospirillum sp.]|uniref:response regulator n=1 Tax=Azospirillum sp. TaxID=34012 RepID=UPI003D73E1DA